MESGDPRDREIEALRRENAELRGRVEQLERLVAELGRQLEEALRASKRQAAPFSKGSPKGDPKRPGRKPGADYGMPTRRPPPDKIDEIIAVTLPPHCECGGGLELEETVSQFQVEIPRRPIHRRFDIQVGRCRRCGRRHQGRHPLQTSDAVGAAASQVGPDAQAMTALMKNKLGLSYGDIRTAFHDFFGIELSRGGAAQIVLRVGDRVQAGYGMILKTVRRSRIVYPDETGWKVRGLLQWLWVFVTRTATAFVIRDSRGHDVPQEVLGTHWSGWMIHDGWSPYDFFEDAQHQQCNAHLLRRCGTLLKTATRGAVRFPRAVSKLLKDGFAMRDRRDAGKLSSHGLAVAVGRLEARLGRLLNWRLSHPGNRRFAKHLSAHRDEIFPFVKHWGIEGTSWPADQASRPAIVNRKVFGGNREPSGARAQERLASIVATCLQRGLAVFEYLSRVLRTPSHQRDNLACHLLTLAPT